MNHRDPSLEELEQLENESLRDEVPGDPSGPASEPDVRTRFDEDADAPSAQSTGITGGR